ncbi:replication-relaxation family protein [Polycladomyces subterraneus]|uniref:replication-relaxation family protein n=1 Tax=Polycladomyces subterraneus TaxID=1016997 RepID=UPI00263B17C7|nr:replication-relaxation family protein [Polycladomyces subterraneus]
MRIRHQGDRRAYSLNKAGIRYVKEMMQSDNLYVKEAPEAHIRHYLGINEILVRLIENGVEREGLIWLFTAEATAYLSRLLEALGEKFDRRNRIRPDAWVVLNHVSFWLEFNNDTEPTRVLERKFRQYVYSLTLTNNTDPVLG